MHVYNNFIYYHKILYHVRIYVMRFRFHYIYTYNTIIMKPLVIIKHNFTCASASNLVVLGDQ